MKHCMKSVGNVRQWFGGVMKSFVAIAALAFAGASWAAEETVNGYTWYYRLTADGKGAELYKGKDAAAISPDPDGAVTIPAKLGGKPVVSIGDYAFDECQSMTAVTIPATVTSIGEGAFYDCEALAHITLPAKLTIIGKEAFKYTGLRSVVIPDSVTEIGESAFDSAQLLEYVQFGKKVDKIGNNAFYFCVALQDIAFKGNMPSQIAEERDDVFYNVPENCQAWIQKNAKGWPPVCCGFSTRWKGFNLVVSDCRVPVEVVADFSLGGNGEVTGDGEYTVGKKVALKAKPASGSVFAGWYMEELVYGEGADEYRTFVGWAQSYSGYTVVGERVRFIGQFATSDTDSSTFKINDCDVWTAYDGTLDLPLFDKKKPYVVSLSEPKLTFKNLPAGLKYDTKTFKIAGKATKPGIYKVTVSATNVSVKKAITAEWTITVPNYYDDEVPVNDYYGDFTPGVAYADMIAEAEGCTVTGLPAGMKWTSKSITDKTLGLVQADSYYGAPTKPGYYTVYFTKTVKVGTKSVKHTSTATFYVGPYPKLTIKTEGATGKDKVTGEGEYAANKKVTLKATPDTSKDNPKVFSGWYDSDGDLISQSPSYSYTMPAWDTEITAKFITSGEDAKGVNVTVYGVDPFNTSRVTEADLSCGVYMAWPIEVETASLSTVKVTGLPAGLKFTAKDIYDTKQKDLRIVSANTIYGTPTKASQKIGLGDLIPSTVQIAVTTAGKYTKYYTIKTYVKDMRNWAVGSFYGGHESGAMQASFTVTSAGKISGKENYMDGQALTDTAPYFTKYDSDSNKYEATIEQKGKDYLDASVIELTQLDGNLGEIWIGSNGIRLYSAPWKDEPCKTLAKKFTTAAAKTLTIDGIKDDESNPGSLTLTFDNAGAVKVKGEFETPTGKYTATGSSMVTPITYIRNADDTFDAYVFVTLPWKTGKFGGYGARFTLFWDGTAFSLK